MSAGSIAAGCPFPGRRGGARARLPRARTMLASGGSQGPTGSGAPFPRTQVVGSSGASSVPFTCQVLGKLKSSVWDVIREREGGRAGVEKCSFHSAGKRAGSSKNAARSPGPRGGVPSSPPDPLGPARVGAEVGGSRPARPLRAATASSKMPLKKCFQCLHLQGFCDGFCDFRSRLQLSAPAVASPKCHRGGHG